MATPARLPPPQPPPASRQTMMRTRRSIEVCDEGAPAGPTRAAVGVWYVLRGGGGVARGVRSESLHICQQCLIRRWRFAISFSSIDLNVTCVVMAPLEGDARASAIAAFKNLGLSDQLCEAAADLVRFSSALDPCGPYYYVYSRRGAGFENHPSRSIYRRDGQIFLPFSQNRKTNKMLETMYPVNYVYIFIFSPSPAPPPPYAFRPPRIHLTPRIQVPRLSVRFAGMEVAH